jgi:hypothetical protein
MARERLFTLDEARALLPTVRVLLVEIQDAKRDLDEATLELERLLILTGGNGHLAGQVSRARASAESTAQGLQNRLAELDDLGIEIKGIEQGLIDFPSMRNDHVVYLCYLLGEDDIAFWHEIDGGFAGRQPL